MLCFSSSIWYNLSETKGFVPKIDDALPYIAPRNTQPLGPLRPENVMMQDLNYAFRDQGIEILKATLHTTVINANCFDLISTTKPTVPTSTCVTASTTSSPDLSPKIYDTVIVVVESERVSPFKNTSTAWNSSGYTPISRWVPMNLKSLAPCAKSPAINPTAPARCLRKIANGGTLLSSRLQLLLRILNRKIQILHGTHRRLGSIHLR